MIVVLAGKKGAAIRVCELLLGGPPLEESERFTRMSGEVASRSSNLRGAAAMNEGDGQMAQRGHELRSRESSASESDLNLWRHHAHNEVHS
jgi:hypothetical protein